jgi:hypothetical protein
MRRWAHVVAWMGSAALLQCAPFEQDAPPSTTDAGSDSGLLDAPTDAPTDAPADAPPSSAYANAVRADDPVAWFRLDDADAVTASDSGRQPEPGTYAGEACHMGQQGALAADPNGAVRFVSCALVLGTRLDVAGQAPFSIEVWVAPELNDENFRWIYWRQGATLESEREGYGLFVSHGNIAFERVQGASFVVALAPLDVGGYRHVVGTYDGLHMRIYVDGEAIQEHGDQRSLAARPDATAIVGGVAVNGASVEANFQGTLDELAFYDEALPANRVKAHFAAGRTH